jgi:hypothetical protein
MHEKADGATMGPWRSDRRCLSARVLTPVARMNCLKAIRRLAGAILFVPVQAQAILDLRLHRLTGFEHEKLLQEYSDKLLEIADYLEILGKIQIACKSGHSRRTQRRLLRNSVTSVDLLQITDSTHDPKR